MEFLIGVLVGAIGGIIAGVVLLYLQRDKVDTFLEEVQLFLFSGQLAKKEAESYLKRGLSHIGTFGAYISKTGSKEKIPYVKLQILPKVMEECVKLYKPDREHEARTWGTVGHVLYEQARKYYNNEPRKKVKILKRAVEAFDKELNIQHDPRAVNRKGQIQILLRQFSEAEKTLYLNISKIENDPHFYSSLRDTELQDSYRRSFYILASLYLGEFLHISDKRIKAIYLFSHYIALQSPDFYQYHVALSKRGTLYMLNGQFELAEADFETIDPNKLEPKVNVGFLRNNQFKLFSNETKKAFHEGNIVLANKCWEKAETAYQRAVQTHEDLKREPSQAYYDRITETDLRQKYESEFQSILEDYYAMKSVLGK
jgi:hypothetical protein